MPVNYNVPFYANTPDGTHCFQATLKMVLKYFWPYKEFDWATLDKITAKQDGMWTWPMAGLCWLVSQGFQVLDIQSFDFERFIAEKEHYISEAYGPEIAQAQIAHSNIDEEVGWATRFLDKVRFEKRSPTIQDITTFLDRGYLLITNVNIHALYNKEGYAGHFVVITGYGKTGLYLHDPGGNKPTQGLFMGMEQFITGWERPRKDAKNLIVIKLK